MHVTLNSNLGMTKQTIERLFIKAILIALIFIVVFTAVFDSRRFVMSSMFKDTEMETVSDWVIKQFHTGKKETLEERLKRLIRFNLESTGGIKAALADTSVKCLAENVYYESRGEPLEGQLAVAHVTMTRLNEGYARSLCGVVKQRNPNGCQFEWVCRSDLTQPGGHAWTQAVGVALVTLNEGKRIGDPTNGASHFHATHIDWQPNWKRVNNSVRQIGNHIFYRVKPQEQK
jgi:hypothetical protein